MDKEIEEVLKALQEVEKLRPVINAFLDTLESMVPEMQRLAGILSDVLVENRLQTIDKYQKQGGLSFDTALQLTIADARMLKDSVPLAAPYSPLWTNKKL